MSAEECVRRADALVVLVSIAAAVVACGGTAESGEAPAEDPAAASSATDNEDTADPGVDGAQEATRRQGIKGRSGTLLIAAEGVSGTEDVYLYERADSGAELELCRIRYDLSETGRRDDCDACLWAVELQTSNARIVSPSPVGCTALGAVGDDPGALNGQVVSYGYNDDYFGHAEVLMSFTSEDGWTPLGFAEVADETDTLSYRAVEGECEY